MTTTAQQLAAALFEQLAGQDMAGWLADQRSAGMSWYAISDAFRDLTGVRVSHASLQNWSDSDRPAA